MNLKNALLWIPVLGLGWFAIPAEAQKTKEKPKNEITKLKQARKKDPTTRQVTPDPKKSPGKHADNLSKNVNRDVNRNSKNFNNGLNNISKGVNRAFQGKKKK